MQVTKAHGTANDFVVIADPDDRLELAPELVRALCDRRQGLGADGLLRIVAGAAGADVFMDYRNADGSIVEMCGNGVRVVAKYAVDHALVEPGHDRLVIDTRDGHKPVQVHRDDSGEVASVTVDMGPPSFAVADLPFDFQGDEAVDVPFAIDGTELRITAVSMGNPHAVTVVEDVAAAPVRTLGPIVEVDPRFPKRTNVEFAAVRDRRHVELRVWERGVGETAACGTGACATQVALARLGLVDDEVEVHVPGGTLVVRYRPDEHPSVFMTGPAIEVATIELDETWLRRATAGEFDGGTFR